MVTYIPTINTIIFLVAFVVLFLGYLLRMAIKNKLDLLDFLMLSTVAILPTFFVVFPGFVSQISTWAGVAFPFLLLFGGLFLIVFLMLFNLIIQTKKLRDQSVSLAQEMALARKQDKSENKN